ncbi:MAG: SMC-Scp complex subunit ScpB [Butyricicoccaceae bacterium]
MTELECILEGILFAAGEPVACAKLMQVLNVPADVLSSTAKRLAQRYDEEQRGIMLVRLDDRYQLCSRPQYADYIRAALETRRTPTLSNAALEVLAIVAYRQPVTRAFIEQLRGVDSSNTVLSLVDKGLIEGCGRLDVPGRPVLYRTTPAFLRTFSLTDLTQLPSLPELGEAEQLTLDTETEEDTNG